MTVDEERTLERTLAQESEDDLLQLAREEVDEIDIPVMRTQGTGHGGAALDDAKREDHARVVAHLATIGVIAPDWWAVYSP